MSPLLSLSGVTCRRGGRLLFETLDLDLAPGDALHLTGPNGSGKSSLLRLAAGLLRPDAGVVTRSEASLADEHLALDRELPLERALRFWTGLDSRGQHLTEAMEALDLAHLAQVPVRFLSTGQAKRASLARTAASGAPLWLLDEPLNGLDAQSVARLDVLVAQHRASGGGVLAASHGPMGGAWSTLELGR